MQMNAIDNSKMQDRDISLGLLLDFLAGAKDSPLVFHYESRPVSSQRSTAAPTRKHGERFSSSYGTSTRTTARICRLENFMQSSAR
jgi:hypothetical protein